MEGCLKPPDSGKYQCDMHVSEDIGEITRCFMYRLSAIFPHYKITPSTHLAFWAFNGDKNAIKSVVSDVNTEIMVNADHSYLAT